MHPETNVTIYFNHSTQGTANSCVYGFEVPSNLHIRSDILTVVSTLTNAYDENVSKAYLRTVSLMFTVIIPGYPI
jgi:hypothetical protein